MKELSEGAQAIIQRYAGAVGGLAGTHAGLCSATGLLPWAHPTAQEYEDLAKVCFWLHYLICHNMSQRWVRVGGR